MSFRILLASDHYPPFIGGAHRQTQLLARELQRRGHQVSVATVWQPGLPLQEEDSGVQVYHLKQLRALLPWYARDPNQRHQPPFPDPVTVWQLRGLINRLEPQVVHSHGWFSYSCAAALLGKDIPLLISARDYCYSCATRSMLYHGRVCQGPSLLKCMACAAHHYGPVKGMAAAASVFSAKPLLVHKVRGIHSVSGFVERIAERDLYQKRAGRLEKMGGPVLERVIPSFLISASKGRPDPEFVQRLPAESYILFVGELQPHKGLKTLLEAYQRLDSPPHLVLIGYVTPGSPKQYPDGVTVLENAPHPTVMEAWRRCLFGVAPSIWPDPSPGVVREAMSQGKAVIGTRIGGMAEMILDGETGLLVAPDDVDGLATALHRLIQEKGLCERLGRAAQERAKVYMDDVSVPGFEHLYSELIYKPVGLKKQGSFSA